MKDKVIVITGGSRGLGKTLADMLRVKGAIVVVGVKNTESDTTRVEVTKETEVTKLAEEAVKSYGHIDIWINNAGVWLPKTSLEEVDLEKAQNLFQVNFFGTLNGMRAALRVMKKQGNGTIVNIISTTAFDGMNGSSGTMYVASKYALRGLTNAVRDEVKDTKISIIGVYPGGFKSELFDAAKPANFDDFMSTESVAEKIIANLEQPQPKTQLILARPGTQLNESLIA